jgi:hypothetical protein
VTSQLECNYNRGNAANELHRRHPGSDIESGRLSPDSSAPKEISPKYDPSMWADIGKAIALAALDVAGANPASRLGPLARRADDLRRMRICVATWAARMQAHPSAMKCPSDDDDDEADEELAALCEEVDAREAEPADGAVSARRPSTASPASPQPLQMSNSPPRSSHGSKRIKPAGMTAAAATSLLAPPAKARPAGGVPRAASPTGRTGLGVGKAPTSVSPPTAQAAPWLSSSSNTTVRA